MEYLCKLTKCELKHILEKVMDKLEEDNIDMYKEYETMIEKCVYDISKEDAKEFVMNMMPLGEVYTYNQVVDLLKQFNNYSESDEEHNIEYYIVMNMTHNDYKHIVEKYNVTNPKQFCYDMAKCFIDDEDCTDYKVSKYILMMS